jgi:hypothetical protein
LSQSPLVLCMLSMCSINHSPLFLNYLNGFADVILLVQCLGYVPIDLEYLADLFDSGLCDHAILDFL